MRHKRTLLLILCLLVGLVAVPMALTWREVRQEQVNHDLIAAITRRDSRAALAALQAGANPNTRAEYMPPDPFWKRVFHTLHGRKRPHYYGPPPLILLLDDYYDLVVLQGRTLV